MSSSSFMKDPPFSFIRRRRATKLKLLVSFNGAFCRRPPYNRLRYTGGETRIISVDRNISFSKLKFKIITDLVRPKAAFSPAEFSLKYYISEAPRAGIGGDGKEREGPILFSLDTDDEVRSMVEDYETMEFNGKFLKRLWVFVCYSNSNDKDGSNDCCFVNNKLENLNTGSSGFYEGKQGFGGIQRDQRLREDEDLFSFLGNGKGKGFDHKSTDHRSKKFNDDSLRKTVLRQQLLAKKLGEIRIFHGLDEQSELELAAEKEDYEALLIDLSSDPESPPSAQSKKINTEGDVGRKVTDYKYLYPHKMPRDYLGKVLSAKQSNSLPLNSKDGNSLGGLDGLEVGFLGQTRKSVGGRDKTCSLESPSEFGAAGHTPKLLHYSGPSSNGNGLETNFNFRRIYQPLLNYKNRENIMPCFVEPRDQVAKWNMHFPPSDSNQLTGTLNTFKSSQCCERGQEGYQGGIHNHKFSSRDVRSHRISQSHFKTGNNLKFGLDGKFYPCFNSKATISKQGPGLRTCIDVSSKPLPHANTACAQMDRLTGPVSDEYHLASEALTAKTLGKPGINGKIPLNISQEKQEDGLNSSNPNNLSHSGRTELSYNYVYGETETGHGSNIYGSGVYTGNDHSASPVNLSLHNLSIETCGNLQQSAHSCARLDKFQSLLTPQSNDLDQLNEEHLKSGPKVEKSSDVCSSSSSEKAAKMGKDDDEKEKVQQDIVANLRIQGKDEKEMTTECSKANNGTLPADVYIHSATRELQNIRNSDLECITELGSGTFGTVYYGKWKGSDVAIKRINPRCFTNGAKGEDRLVADFWKEAHILGQLRHPNIVALYGVASDGPLDSYATVTEYMVNGSLKQVLRRKDRTIDRKKRLIIAMDAACGMEYLHEKNIVHFDLKSHNFLMNMRDLQRPVCKIGDLGLSKIKQRTLVSGGVRGTLPWMAPELLNGSNLVSEKVDVYSFGIVLWELSTCEEPYENMRSEEIIAGIIRGDLRPEVPSWCDPAWRSLMERCWSSDPDSRPAFSEIAKKLRAMAASMNIR